jgi:hypothetical protein
MQSSVVHKACSAHWAGGMTRAVGFGLCEAPLLNKAVMNLGNHYRSKSAKGSTRSKWGEGTRSL